MRNWVPTAEHRPTKWWLNRWRSSPAVDPGTVWANLACHWLLAPQPKHRPKAIAYAQLAGDAAMADLAPANAVDYYTQALALLGQADDQDPELELDLAIGLGSAQIQSGNPECRDTLLDAARRADALGDRKRLTCRDARCDLVGSRRPRPGLGRSHGDCDPTISQGRSGSGRLARLSLQGTHLRVVAGTTSRAGRRSPLHRRSSGRRRHDHPGLCGCDATGTGARPR